MNGSTTSYETAKGTRWRWTWSERLANGKTHQHSGKGFLKMKDAQTALRASLAEYDKGHRTNPATGTTVSEWLALWLVDKRSTAAPSSIVSFQLHIDRITPHLGDMKLRDVKKANVLTFIRELRKPGANKVRKNTPLSEGTIGITLKTLSQALKAAAAEGYISSNPCNTITIPKSDELPGTVWNVEELTAFLTGRREAGDKYITLWELLACTGCRRGEAIGLKWRNVNLDQGYILIMETRGRVKGKMVDRKATKTKGSLRTVAIDLEDVLLLRRHKEAQELSKALAGEGWDNTDLVFTDDKGNGLHVSRIDEAWAKAIKESNAIPTRVHDLRHGHATILLTNGIDAKTVSERLGHADPGYTLRIYAHVLEGRQAEAASIYRKARTNAYAQSVPKPSTEPS